MTEHVINNFDAMNQAIDRESERARGLIELYNVDRQQRRARTFLYVCVGLASLIIAVGIMVWLVTGGGSSSPQLKEGNADHSKELERLDASHTTEDRSVSTKFTVFINSTTEAGEEVITGLVYSPEDITSPVEQYCYLQGADVAGAMAGIQLAAFEREGGLKVYAESPSHNKLVEYHCNFKSYQE